MTGISLESYFSGQNDPNQILNELDRIDSEDSLCEFLKIAWPILEPGRQFSPGWHIDAICDHLEAVTYGQITRLLINVPPGCMKNCANSTPCPTPNGYKTHGDLRPGDYVFGPDGLPTRIKSISKPVITDYEVTFSNGEVIKCNGEHLWGVYDRFNGRKYGVYTVLDILARGPIRDINEKRDRSRYKVPDFKALQFPEKDLPLHPYFLGCWLGDGTSSSTVITHSIDDSGHIDKLKSLGYNVTRHTNKKGKACRSSFTFQGVTESLRKLDVHDNKHIPEIYLTASVEQRLELLAGLIDTDGSVHQKRGRVSIYTCEEILAKQINQLAYSLGFRAHTFSRPVPNYGKYKSDKTSYVISFEPNLSIPTAIPRKKTFRLNAKRRGVSIVSIEKSKNPEMGHCINVEREDGLYIVGINHVVTHNSLTTEVFWPAWEWGPKNMASMRYVSSSYSEALTIRDNRKMRSLIKHPWYQSNWGNRFQILPDQDSKTRFENDKTGFKIATSVGGLGTGERGDRVIIDDPHNVKDGESELVRNSTLMWFTEVMPTRINDPEKSSIIVIMQRVHEEDVSGYIIAKELGYECLILPMEYEPDRHCKTTIGFSDPRTEENELLWPNRMNRTVVERDKKIMGMYASAGQYQQRPSPRGGGMFKKDWFEVVDAVPMRGRKVARGWDLASTESEDAAYTAGVKMSVVDGIYYIEDCDRFRGSPEKVETRVKNTASQDGKFTRISIPQDPGQAGKSQKTYYAKQLAGYDVRFSPESGEKEVRAMGLAAQAEAGNVKIVRGAWNGAFFDELCTFPASRFKDQVDAASRAFHALITKKNNIIPTPPETINLEN